MTDAQRRIYHGKIVDLTVEQFTLPNGAVAEYEVVHHPGGAAVVALDAGRRVCLLRQYRPVVGGWIWELPAGKLEPEESALRTAQRELEEEAGRRADQWRPLGTVLSSPGIFTEVIHLFLATDLSIVDLNHETHEVIEVHWLALSEALERVQQGAIVDGKTQIGLYRAQAACPGG